ncbi:uncharacterized protein [Nicotiana sylvestris]|uniref:uncharacterized protein n=1 Tax=Nicotiana sylvestris TaxID=4096 RepID=UPI00388C3DB2
MVADALSRKAESMRSLAFIPDEEMPLALDVQALENKFVRLDISELNRILACMISRSSLFEYIKVCRYDDPHLLVLKDTVQNGVVGDEGVLKLHGRICVPNIDGLWELILEEAHNWWYFIQLGVAKMYHNLKQHYWWTRMKKDIIEYVARCLKCFAG